MEVAIAYWREKKSFIHTFYFCISQQLSPVILLHLYREGVYESALYSFNHFLVITVNVQRHWRYSHSSSIAMRACPIKLLLSWSPNIFQSRIAQFMKTIFHIPFIATPGLFVIFFDKPSTHTHTHTHSVREREHVDKLMRLHSPPVSHILSGKCFTFN